LFSLIPSPAPSFPWPLVRFGRLPVFGTLGSCLPPLSVIAFSTRPPSRPKAGAGANGVIIVSSLRIFLTPAATQSSARRPLSPFFRLDLPPLQICFPFFFYGRLNRQFSLCPKREALGAGCFFPFGPSLWAIWRELKTSFAPHFSFLFTSLPPWNRHYYLHSLPGLPSYPSFLILLSVAQDLMTGKFPPSPSPLRVLIRGAIKLSQRSLPRHSPVSDVPPPQLPAVSFRGTSFPNPFSQ